MLDSQFSKIFVFNEHELGTGRIYNPTKVAGIIGSYLQKNSLLNRAGVVVFDSMLMTEQLVSLNDRSVDMTSCMHVKTAVNQDLHYQAVLKTGMLLQYQLLFLQIGLYIETFTSEMILSIQHLRCLAKKDLSCVDNLAKLQEVINTFELDLHTKFVQTIGII